MLLPNDFGEALKVGLFGKFSNAYNKYPTLYTKAFKRIPSTRAYEQLLSYAGIGLLAPRNPGEEAASEDPTQGYLVTVTPSGYSKSMLITEELMEDDQNNIVSTFPGLLAKSARESEEVLAHTLLNNGWATTGYDSVVLFSASHPKIGGGTASNLITAASLSLLSLSGAKTQIAKATDDKGYRILIRPKTLWVPPDLEDTAKEILNSTGRPDSAYRGINPLYGAMDIQVSPFLTSTTAWFIQVDGIENGLVYIDRIGNEQRVDNYPGKRAIAHYIHKRLVYTYADWRAFYGNAGA